MTRKKAYSLCYEDTFLANQLDVFVNNYGARKGPSIFRKRLIIYAKSILDKFGVDWSDKRKDIMSGKKIIELCDNQHLQELAELYRDKHTPALWPIYFRLGIIEYAEDILKKFDACSSPQKSR